MEKKIIKKSPIWPLRHQEDVVAIYRSREEPQPALPLHSNEWDELHQWRGCRNSSWTWVPLKEMREFEREVEIEEEDEGQIMREWEGGRRFL